MSWFSTKLFVVNCASGISNLSILDQSDCFWSFVLEIEIPLLSKHRIIPMFYNMMPVHSSSSGWVPMLTSDPLWTTGSFVEFFIRQRPSYSITLWAFPRIHNAFGKLYPLLCEPCSTFELVLFTPKFVVYVPKMPWWVEPTPSLIRVNPKDFTGHTYLVLHQVKTFNN